MARTIFVNLPVNDVEKSSDFYTALGFERNAQFSQAGKVAAMAWSESITVMLLDRAVYATFTPKPIIDAHTTSGVLIALSFDDRAGVDAITDAAIAAGGREAHEPEELGFMYSRAFEDLDGHGFGPMWMDVSAATAAAQSAAQHA